MAMGTRQTEQSSLWVATSELPTSPGHPFYARLNALLDAHDFDRCVEGLCRKCYAKVMGRPSLQPGRYFRLLLLGDFEGIDSERGIAWRASDSLTVHAFLRLPLDEAPPDHSTISRTRRAIDIETHRAVGGMAVHDLARDIGFSRRHFGERFTSEFGIAPEAAPGSSGSSMPAGCFCARRSALPTSRWPAASTTSRTWCESGTPWPAARPANGSSASSRFYKTTRSAEAMIDS